MLQTNPTPLDFLTTPGKFQLGARVMAMLAEPFPLRGDDDRIVLQKKIQNMSGKKDKANISYYITIRDLHGRLNDVVGPLNWRQGIDSIVTEGINVFIAASMSIADNVHMSTGEGCTEKWGKPHENALTTAESQAVKRAAVPFGIGAYLYRLSEVNTWNSALKEVGNAKYLQYDTINVKDDPIDRRLPDWMFPAKGPTLVMRELGFLLGVNVPVNLRDLDKADAKTMKDLLKKSFGVESLTSSSGLGWEDYFKLAACIARITDYCTAHGKSFDSVCILPETPSE